MDLAISVRTRSMICSMVILGPFVGGVPVTLSFSVDKASFNIGELLHASTSWSYKTLGDFFTIKTGATDVSGNLF